LLRLFPNLKSGSLPPSWIAASRCTGGSGQASGRRSTNEPFASNSIHAICASNAKRRSRFRYKQWTIPGQTVDLIVEDIVLVEIKTVPRLRPVHRKQVLSYLKTMDLRIGLLMNFSAEVLKQGLGRVVN
jgi:GxxExxY protein